MLVSIILSTVFLAVMILFRTVLRGKISARFIYGMWGLVALRLLIPVPLLEAPVDVRFEEEIRPNQRVEMTDISQRDININPIVENPNKTVMNPSTGNQGTANVSQGTEEMVNKSAPEEKDEAAVPMVQDSKSGDTVFPSFAVKQMGLGIWGGVSIVVFLAFLLSNFHMFMKLRRTRQTFGGNSDESHPPIYVSSTVNMPCLYGLFRPAVYLPEYIRELPEEEAAYILLHEKMHYKHRDNIWVALRIVLVSLFWFHPLVWLAARLSKQDSEYAVDEAVLYQLGEEKQIRYGETIVHTLRAGMNRSPMVFYGCTAVSSKKEMKKRLQMMAKRKKKSWVVVGVLTVIMLGLSACSLMGKENATGESPEITEESITDEPKEEKSNSETADTPEKKRDLAIQAALIENVLGNIETDSTWRYVGVENLCKMESHTILREVTDEKDNSIVTYYIFAHIGAYGRADKNNPYASDCFIERGGSDGFYVVTVKEQKGEYKVTKLWGQSESKDFSELRKAFPESISDYELKAELYSYSMESYCHDKALQYLKEKEEIPKKKQVDIPQMEGTVESVDMYMGKYKIRYVTGQTDNQKEAITMNNSSAAKIPVPDFWRKLVNAYSKLDKLKSFLAPVENLEAENAMDIQSAITLNFHIRKDDGKEEIRQIIFDKNGVCWLHGQPYTWKMKRQIFPVEQIEQCLGNNM